MPARQKPTDTDCIRLNAESDIDSAFSHYLRAQIFHPKTEVFFKKTNAFNEKFCELFINETRCSPKGGLPGCSPPPPRNRQNRNLENTDFTDIIISGLLRDFPFSRNQPLKSVDDQYIGILKNKLIKLKKQEDRTL
jgi:hypothetical protein